MAVNSRILTLEEFTIQSIRNLKNATGELSALLRDIGLAAKRIHAKVRKLGLVDMLGDTGTLNIHGEDVKQMDIYANEQLINVLKNGGNCAGIGSEELEHVVVFDNTISNLSKYVVLFDPLDGSSNIDTNMSIGTIFGVYRRLSEKGTPCTLQDFLQQGLSQVAAGYVIYGSSAMFVYATRQGVNGFTLDPEIGEFSLSHADIRCPPNGKIYSVNHGNFYNYKKSIQHYISCCQQKDSKQGGPYTNRYTGSMVADVHRTLIKGGIFMYPGYAAKPQGKLRLLYECNPFAFITEVAGGKASNGKQRILELLPTDLHQRTPFIVGSREMVDECLGFLLDSTGA